MPHPSNPLLRLLADNRNVSGRRAGVVAAKPAADVATVYLYDAIVSDAALEEMGFGVSAQTLVPKIAAIDADVIHLRINSPGGDVFAGQAIAQALREQRAQVVAHVDGVAASAASVVLAAADVRVIAPGAFVMVHNSWSFVIGNSADMLAAAELLEQVDDSIAAQYARAAGGTQAQWRERMAAETWFGAQAAIDAGLVSAISDGSESAQAQWRLAAYAHAPAQAAPAPAAQPTPAGNAHAHEQALRRLHLIERTGRVSQAAAQWQNRNLAQSPAARAQ